MKEEVEKLLTLLPAMKKRFEAAGSRYHSLLSSITPDIKKFEWCKGSRYSHFPFGVERSGRKAARLVKSPPKDKNYMYRYGFDASDRVLIEEIYVEFEGQKYETFWEYLENRIETTHYSYWREKPAINVESTFFEGGIATSFIRYAARGLVVESYEYSSGVLTRAHRASQEHNPSSPRHKLTESTDHFVYDGGNLIKVVRDFSTGSEVIFPRRHW